MNRSFLANTLCAAILMSGLLGTAAPALAQTTSPYELFTRLYRDASAGDLAAVKRWVTEGADVNYQFSQTKGTALMAAAQSDRIDVVRYLLEQGADPHLKDWNGYTALDYAKSTGDKKLIALLENAMNGQKAPPLPKAPSVKAPTTPAAAPRSALVNASFTPDATLITDASATREFASALQQAASLSGDTCQKSEYVLWEKIDPQLQRQFNAGVQALGFTRNVLHEEQGDEFVSVFQLKKSGQNMAGLWVESEGVTVLAWCTLKSSTPATTPPAQTAKQPAPTLAAKPAANASKTAWPAFGTFKVGDEVQVFRSTGWKRQVVVQVGPQPGQGGNFEKQYVVNDPGVTTWNDFYDWGYVAHTERQPYWTGFFIGDWKVGEAMAINTRTDGTYAWNEVAYASASDTLRVKADGTYEWKDMNGKVTKGKWRAAPDGPGVVVKDTEGRDWTLRNNTNVVEERIRKIESARLYPSDKSQTSMAATRPIKR